jgi:hypothetical protein
MLRRKRKRRPEVGKDFVWEGGRFVFTREYLLSLGECCGNDCPRCPYKGQAAMNHENSIRRMAGSRT